MDLQICFQTYHQLKCVVKELLPQVASLVTGCANKMKLVLRAQAHGQTGMQEGGNRIRLRVWEPSSSFQQQHHWMPEEEDRLNKHVQSFHNPLHFAWWIAQCISWTGYHFCPLNNFQWIFSFEFLPRPSRRHWHPHILCQWLPQVSCLLRDKQILLIQEGFSAFPFLHKWSLFSFSVPLMMLLTQVGNCWLCAAGWWQREVTEFSLRLSSK